MLQPNRERAIFTSEEMKDRPIIKRKIDDDLVAKPVKKKAIYKPTKLEAQNIKDAVRGVNKNPQMSDMIGIPMDNKSIIHLRKKFDGSR